MLNKALVMLERKKLKKIRLIVNNVSDSAYNKTLYTTLMYIKLLVIPYILILLYYYYIVNKLLIHKKSSKI